MFIFVPIRKLAIINSSDNLNPIPKDIPNYAERKDFFNQHMSIHMTSRLKRKEIIQLSAHLVALMTSLASGKPGELTRSVIFPVFC